MPLVNKTPVIALLFIFINIFNNCYAQDSSPFQGEINTDNINIRSDATVSSEIICKAHRAEPIEVITELYGWYKIRLPKNAPSFIKKSLVSSIENKTAKVLKDNVNIRLYPSESSPILGIVNNGEPINILEDKGEWYRIEPVNSSFGWVNKKFVNKSARMQELKLSNKGIKKNKAVEDITAIPRY